MFTERKFDRKELTKLLKKGHSPAECARILKVSRAAIRKAQKKMLDGTVKIIAQRDAAGYKNMTFNALDQIKNSNSKMLWLQTELVKYLKGEKTELQRMERKRLLKWVEKDADGNKKSRIQEVIEKFDLMSDPVRSLILIDAAVNDETRTLAKVLEVLGPVKEMNTVHNTIIDYLDKNWDPDARTKIMEGIKQILGYNPLLQFGGQKMGDDAPGTGGERLRNQEPTEAEGGDGVDSPNGSV